MELKLKVFFFDAKKDYLPYYKKINIDINEKEPIINILPLIKDKDFAYSKKNPLFRVNSLVIDESVLVEDVVNRFNNELIIEPLSIYRAKNSLLIDDSNFYSNFKLLEKFCNPEDIEYYNELYGIFYASDSFEFNKKYISDAIIILAEHLITKYKDKEQEILEIITQENGLWDGDYENNMFKNIDYSLIFETLKQKANNPPKNKVNALFTKKYKDLLLSNEFNIAIYGSNKFKKEIKQLGFNLIDYEASNKKCGLNLINSNEKFALLKAGRVLASAFDSGADILVVEKKEILDYLKNNIGKIEKILNRELLISLYSINELSKLKAAA